MTHKARLGIIDSNVGIFFVFASINYHDFTFLIHKHLFRGIVFPELEPSGVGSSHIEISRVTIALDVEGFVFPGVWLDGLSFGIQEEMLCMAISTI